VPESNGASTLAYVFKTIADPYSGKISLLRVFAGTLKADLQLVTAAPTARSGSARCCWCRARTTARRPSSARADRRRCQAQETNTGDVLADVDKPAPVEPIALPAPVDVVRHRAKSKGDEDKVHASAAAAAGGGPLAGVHRDEETGETIVGGLSQMHVETVLERMHRRFGVRWS